MPQIFEENWVQKELVFPGALKTGAQDNGVGGVTRVQEWATFHGFATGVDGAFGPATERVVWKFQAAKGLSKSGSVDQATFQALVAPLALVLTPPASRPGTLSEAIVACAKLHAKVHPIEIGGPNSGPWVRLYMKGQQGAEWLWCAGFACTIVRQASEWMEVPSPVAYQVGCNQLAHQAKTEGRFVRGAAAVGHVQPGSLFLIRSKTAADQWTHTGVVIDVGANSFTTIEGNTDHAGSANGFEVCERERAYSRADFFAI